MDRRIWLAGTAFALVASLGGRASAQSRWKEIGTTTTKSVVSVEPKSIVTKDGITTARIQVRFPEPVKAPKGNWQLLRQDAMFDCAKRKIAVKSSTYYADIAATKIVDSRKIARPGFGPSLGGATDLALDYICKR